MIFNPQYRMFSDIPEPQYVQFTSPNSFTIAKNNRNYPWDGTMYYSTDGSTWNEWDGTSLTAESVDEGYALYFRGSNNTHLGKYPDVDSWNTKWVLTGSDITLSGNIESLLDYSTVDGGGHPTMGIRCFVGWMSDNTALVSASGLLLPAPTLSASCYSSMFKQCSNLVSAPNLPATTLAENCYYEMFYWCSSLEQITSSIPASSAPRGCCKNMFWSCEKLVTPPTLPATTVSEDCYNGMFSHCSSLTSVPSLPATTAAKACYRDMFNGCVSLTTAKRLPATTVAYSCYQGMFEGCSNLEVLPKLSGYPSAYESPIPTSCFSYMFYNCPKVKISITQDSEYTTSYVYGSTNNYNFFNNMFYGTGGTFTGTPSGNRYFYTSNAVNTVV